MKLRQLYLLRITVSLILAQFAVSIFCFGQTTERFVTLQEGYDIWTKSIGQGDVKIILVHGGPGNSHEYLEIFEEYLSPQDYQLIWYDQLGSYRSDKPVDTALYKIERFVDEIEQIRQAYKFDHNFFLIGHSWGGLLAMEYSLKYPDRLQGLIVSNKSYSHQRLVETSLKLWDSLAMTYPSGEQLIHELSNNLQVSDTLTMNLIDAHFNRLFRCRLDPVPEPILRSRLHTNRSVKVSDRNTWTIAARLSQIKSSTLIIGARHDFVDEADLTFMHERIENSHLYISPNGSHYAFWDDAMNYFNAVEAFIRYAKK